MNVLLISQCNKNALKETRRILDQFAERCGDKVWQTAITSEGLTTLRKLLRKRARKNTAVACHWIKGRNRSELLWIVGNAAQFNDKGTVPTNMTHRNIVRSDDENDWHSGQLIHLLTTLAALFHDMGKASKAFQDRLLGNLEGRNLYRHEWVSLRLFEAFVGTEDDDSWLTRLENLTPEDDEWITLLKRDGIDSLKEQDLYPFANLPPLAAAIGWLILSHHRLPALPVRDDNLQQKWVGARTSLNTGNIPELPMDISAGWNERVEEKPGNEVIPYWQFPDGLPMFMDAWQTRARRAARQLKSLHHPILPMASPYVMHLSRMALMLADHHYSSLTNDGRLRGPWSSRLFANTDRHKERCQSLDEHLLGVTRTVGDIVHRMPDMARSLPRIARHKGFSRRSKDSRFRWQDKAFDLATSLRSCSHDHGFFGINMASTGCGKTIANGRIMYALNDPEIGARFSIALGLRTLTLQTGQAYRDKLGLDSDDMAIRVGGSAVRSLYEHAQSTWNGSESREELLDEQSHVLFDGQLDEHPLLSRAVRDPDSRSLLSAPVLVCTIDHLMPATESLRGGSQIVPMLRLMSSDLILDEPDDFGLEDIPGLTRLVYWAGMLGSRILLSSATLPPTMLQGLFSAYHEGRAEYQRHRGVPGIPVAPCCAWFDEYGCSQVQCADSTAFTSAHDSFAQERAARLKKQDVLRSAYLASLVSSSSRAEDITHALGHVLLTQSKALHDNHHSIDPVSGKRVSFGLVRMANIEPLVDLAQWLYRSERLSNFHIHLCVYHSQFPLLLRSRLESTLDHVLDRHDEYAVFDFPDIRQRIDQCDMQDQLFIVLGSPVTEVGRDHDYDWALVEPSSMRSIIQLAGRVRRHRHTAVSTPNIALLSTNIRHLKKSMPAFYRPGFESEPLLASYQLESLLREEEYTCIDSRPRLIPAEPLTPTQRLADLEHSQLGQLMIEGYKVETTGKQRKRRGEPKRKRLGAYLFFRPASLTLSALATQQQPFRRDDLAEDEFVLLPDEDEENYSFQRINYGSGKAEPIQAESQFTRISDESLKHPDITPWNETDYMNALEDQATAMGMTLLRCASRFGRISLKSEYTRHGWYFHPALGFVGNK